MPEFPPAGGRGNENPMETCNTVEERRKFFSFTLVKIYLRVGWNGGAWAWRDCVTDLRSPSHACICDWLVSGLSTWVPLIRCTVLVYTHMVCCTLPHPSRKAEFRDVKNGKFLISAKERQSVTKIRREPPPEAEFPIPPSEKKNKLHSGCSSSGVTKQANPNTLVAWWSQAVWWIKVPSLKLENCRSPTD